MSKKTIGQLSDEILVFKAKVKDLEEQQKVLKEEQAVLEKELADAAEAQGITKGGGANSAFSIDSSVVPQVSDWDKFYGFIHRNKYYHLLERRPATLGCRELFETKGAIPGVDKFVKQKVSVKAL